MENSKLETTRFKKISDYFKTIKIPTLRKYTLYELIKLYITGIIKGTFGYRTRAISFTLALAVFPFTLFTLNLIPYIPINNFQEEFILFIQHIIPESSNVLIDVLIDVIQNKRGGLLSISAVISILFMSNGIYAILSCFEFSYYNQFSRNPITRFLISIAISLLMSCAVLGIVLIYLYLEILSMKINFSIRMGMWNNVIEYGLLIGLTLFLNTILFIASIPQRKSKRLFIFGLTFTTILMLISTYLLGLYLQYILDFNEIYGSIGFILTFLIFIWITANILLLGFELTYTLQHIEEIEDINHKQEKQKEKST